jgi:hypothetical protein
MKRSIIRGLTIFCRIPCFRRTHVTQTDYLSYGLLDGQPIVKFNLLGAAVRNYPFNANESSVKEFEVLLSSCHAKGRSALYRHSPMMNCKKH